MPTDDSTKILYFVVVDGLDAESRLLLRERHPGSSGGANPETLLVHYSIQCDLHEIDGCMAWIADVLNGRYVSLSILVNVSTRVSWANVIVPPGVLDAAIRHRADLKVSFLSPPIFARVPQGGA